MAKTIVTVDDRNTAGSRQGFRSIGDERGEGRTAHQGHRASSPDGDSDHPRKAAYHTEAADTDANARIPKDEMQARLTLILGVLLAGQAIRTSVLQDGCGERQKAHERAVFLQESTT